MCLYNRLQTQIATTKTKKANKKHKKEKEKNMNHQRTNCKSQFPHQTPTKTVTARMARQYLVSDKIQKKKRTTKTTTKIQKNKCNMRGSMKFN